MLNTSKRITEVFFLENLPSFWCLLNCLDNFDIRDNDWQITLQDLGWSCSVEAVRSNKRVLFCESHSSGNLLGTKLPKIVDHNGIDLYQGFPLKFFDLCQSLAECPTFVSINLSMSTFLLYILFYNLSSKLPQNTIGFYICAIEFQVAQEITYFRMSHGNLSFPA